MKGIGSQQGNVLLSVVCLSGLVAGCAPREKRPVDLPAEEATVSAVTGAAEALARITTQPEEETNPSLSPDGKWLLFVVKGSGAKSPLVLNMLSLSGSRERRILTRTTSSNYRGVWHPSEDKLLYITSRQGFPAVVETFDTRGGSAVKYVTTSGMGNPTTLDVNPDASEVVFSAGPQESALLNLVEMDGTNLRSLCEGLFPRFSPDGGLLCFTRSVGGIFQLFTASAVDGSSLTQLTSENDSSYQGGWSPDGQSIAFISQRVMIDSRKYPHLFIMDKTGKNVRQLTDGKVLVSTPSFGKDGYIYFAATDANPKKQNWDIYRLRPVAGGNRRK